ncbi:hypothetical protein Tco_1254998 [Tanacetum coccineum]
MSDNVKFACLELGCNRLFDELSERNKHIIICPFNFFVKKKKSSREAVFLDMMRLRGELPQINEEAANEEGEDADSEAEGEDYYDETYDVMAEAIISRRKKLTKNVFRKMRKEYREKLKKLSKKRNNNV